MTTPPKTPDELIEAAARLIDPRAFEWLDTVGGIECASAIAEAKHKAREIAALYGLGDGGGSARAIFEHGWFCGRQRGAKGTDEQAAADWAVHEARHTQALSHLPSGGEVKKDNGLDQSGLQTCAADSLTTAPDDEDHYPSHEALSELIHLLSEHDALSGGGPGWQERWDKAVRIAEDLVRIEP